MTEYDTSNKIISGLCRYILGVLDGIPEDKTDPKIEKKVQELYEIVSKLRSNIKEDGSK